MLNWLRTGRQLGGRRNKKKDSWVTEKTNSALQPGLGRRPCNFGLAKTEEELFSPILPLFGLCKTEDCWGM